MSLMMTDMKPIADCPRRQIYNTPEGTRMICKAMPVRLDLPFEEFVAHPELYTQRAVTVEDCERCLNKKLPTLVTQLKNYTTALKDWAIAGVPTRSDEEVQRIYDICFQCDALVDGKCTECGCPINLDSPSAKNKLKMMTTKCNRGLW